MPTRYEALLFVHLLGVVVWLGGFFFTLLLLRLASRSRDREGVVRLIEADEWLGPLVYLPATLAVLGGGIGLMLDGNWDFEGWIVGGLVAIAAAYVLVFAAFNPAAKRVLALARQPGASSPEYERKLRRLEAIGWTELAVLVGALFLMTTKPF